MQTKQTLLSYGMLTDSELEHARSLAADLVKVHCEMWKEDFPDSNSIHQFYPKTQNTEWTTGFWTGQIWLAYGYKRYEILKYVGEAHVESFLKRILDKTDVNHHDMGFLYSPSCVAAYQLTGNEKARQAALLASDQMLSRFCENGQFFQAWGDMGKKENYRLIIDCLLNMPLLFWATRVTGKKVYKEKASAHIRTAMNYVIRPDCSTYHTYFFDPKTGNAVKGATFQGNRDKSAWTRGQAWGIYGAALSYRELRNPEYVEIFRKVTDYFLKHLPKDLIPYWDFDFCDGSTEPRDSSAAAIAACGMLEMSRYLADEEAEFYTGMARRLVTALWKHCAVKQPTESSGLILHGTYARGTDTNPCTDRGVDECTVWGDYFYLEALTRLSVTWDSYW